MDLFFQVIFRCNLLGTLYKQALVFALGSFEGQRNLTLCSTEDLSSAAFFANYSTVINGKEKGTLPGKQYG